MALRNFSPLARQLSRPSPLFLRAISTTPISRNALAPESSASQAAAQPDVELEPLSYFVHRTPSQQLPIYETRKRGGSLLQTRIRKITGSVEDLKSVLQQELGLEDGKIAINPITRHILIKGHVKHQVAAFLEKQRF